MHGVVYVVDSAASSRLAENQQVIAGLDGKEELVGKPILFLLVANPLESSLIIPPVLSD